LEKHHGRTFIQAIIITRGCKRRSRQRWEKDRFHVKSASNVGPKVLRRRAAMMTDRKVGRQKLAWAIPV
jgi:hypothetical protein